MKIIDAKGKLRRPLSGRRELYWLARIAHPTWYHWQCAVQAGASKKRAFALAALWESHPEVQASLALLTQNDTGAALESRERWERKTDGLVDRAADAGQYGPALGGMKTLGQAKGYLVERVESKNVNVNLYGQLDGKSIEDIQRRRRELGLDAPNA